MKIIPLSPQAIIEAVAILKAGKVAVIPTETAYGLAGDFFNKSAYQKIYAIKGRAWSKPLSAIVSKQEQLVGLVDWPEIAQVLAQRYWPGPLTLILPLTQKAKAKLIHHHSDNLAVRQSSQPLANALAEQFILISATSANLSGQGELYRTVDVIEQFQQAEIQPDLVIDAGNLPPLPPSTIIDCSGQTPVVARQGSIIVSL